MTYELHRELNQPEYCWISSGNKEWNESPSAERESKGLQIRRIFENLYNLGSLLEEIPVQIEQAELIQVGKDRQIRHSEQLERFAVLIQVFEPIVRRAKLELFHPFKVERERLYSGV